MSASGGYGASTPRVAVGFVFALAASFVALIWWTPIATATNSLNDPAIVTESGPLKGVVTAQINEYLGIPYTAPPVGALRWMPPRRFGRWQGVFKATQFGNECPQTDTSRSFVGDENCLFLNVYTPKVRKNQDKDNGHKVNKDHDEDDGLAVMVWIHGGGLTTGAGSEFDPTPLIEGGNVIVVTINYRLGVLGFFAHPAIDSENHLAGNYGFMD